MWTQIAHVVIKYRLPLMLMLAAITIFMAFTARKIELSYDFAKTVPSTDPDMMFFEQFKEQFGEDSNIIALGMKDSSVYDVDKFTRLKYFSDGLEKVEGVNQVLSLASLQKLVRDKRNKNFDLVDVFENVPNSQGLLDSLMTDVNDLKFYEGQLINSKNGAMLLLLTLEKESIESEDRYRLIGDVQHLGQEFTKYTGIELHYAGLPYVRAEVSGKIGKELYLFLALSALVTATFLFLFFRSWDAVLFPMMVIGMTVIWSLGTIVLLGYKITLLTALVAPIMVVIGIPNCVYLLNKYHQEYDLHGNQVKALSRIIRKIGLATLITNITTAVGFLVLGFTDIKILKEFGIVVGINIVATFLISIILIPGVFSYLKAPSKSQLKHLQFRPVEKILEIMDGWVKNHRPAIYVITAIICALSLYGFTKIESVSFMVDDIPAESTVRTDLDFFEKNFSGVMPLEIIVDTKKKNGVRRIPNLRKVEKLERYLAEQENLSKPVSLVSFIKASRQAYYNNNPKFFALPNNQDKNFIFKYLQNNEEESNLLSTFVDSTGQKMRVSLKVADIGSTRMDSLVENVIRPKVAEIFPDSSVTVDITGTTLLFIKGNKFLIDNLQKSLLLAFFIIAIIMGMLFRNVRMIIISLLPNVIPLLITAGVMGFFGVPLKPSTAIIFSIAFGISVDDSIHYLAKYRQELFANKFNVPIAASASLKETGISMMYTSAILFAGFVIFTASEFGGTQALGLLTSLTLLIAMLTNLILLPSLLNTFDDGKRNEGFEPPISKYDEELDVDHVEDIELSKIQVRRNNQDL